MNKVKSTFGEHLFSKLKSILKNDEKYRTKIFYTRRLLEKLFLELTSDEDLQGKNNLINLQQFFFYKYQYEGNIEDKSHKLRQLCNKSIHFKKNNETNGHITYNPTKEDYIKVITTFSNILSYFSEIEIPKEIKEFISTEENKPEKTVQELKDEDLFNNPDPRIPVILVLDTSISMMIKDEYGNSRIDLLNNGVRQFYDDVINSERTKDSVEICIVSFDKKVKKIADFNTPENQTIPILKAKGNGTLMNEGVKVALKLLNDRKKEYQDMGVAYYQPWLVLMTDGFPTDNIKEATQLTSDLAKSQKLTIFPVGISQGADLNILNMFSPLRPALHLKEYQFSEFFEWLYKSAVSLSESTPNAKDFKIPEPKLKTFE